MRGRSQSNESADYSLELVQDLVISQTVGGIIQVICLSVCLLSAVCLDLTVLPRSRQTGRAICTARPCTLSRGRRVPCPAPSLSWTTSPAGMSTQTFWVSLTGVPQPHHTDHPQIISAPGLRRSSFRFSKTKKTWRSFPTAYGRVQIELILYLQISFYLISIRFEETAECVGRHCLPDQRTLSGQDSALISRGQEADHRAMTPLPITGHYRSGGRGN